MTRTFRPTMLVVLDGWGWREDAADNAVAQARTPCFDRLWATCPHALLRTSGRDVGLPEGQMGNSEVGHTNIGAGRVVMQELPRIDDAVARDALADLPAMRALVTALRASSGTCHLWGLVSPGGVHAHQAHALALARAVTAAGIRVALHVVTDGRDCPPRSAAAILAGFEPALPAGARIATVGGRFHAMDRDHRWERVAPAFAAMVDADGPRFATAAGVVAAAYAAGIGDEFIVPAVVGDYAGMRDGDGLLCSNFRADRVRELLDALLDPAFDGFAGPRVPRLAAAVAMTRYGDALAGRMAVLFPPEPMRNFIGEVVAEAGRTQLRAAETEKFPHVTYFMNGGREAPFPGEDRVMVPSPKVATYDLQPEMSALELTGRVVAAIEAGRHDFIAVNFANPDMVGHTGSLAAAIRAVETVDGCLARIAAALEAGGGAMLVIADHGNAELMRDPATGAPHTAHTTNPVPAILYGSGATRLDAGRLADVAPTLLALMGLAPPAEMTGRDLAA